MDKIIYEKRDSDTKVLKACVIYLDNTHEFEFLFFTPNRSRFVLNRDELKEHHSVFSVVMAFAEHGETL